VIVKAWNVEIVPGLPDGHVLELFEEGEPILDGDLGDIR